MATSRSFKIENARIIFRNFKGAESQWNREGDRNFSIVLTLEDAERLLNDGWNVKYLEAREEGDDPVPYIGIAVSYKHRPPNVVMLTDRARTHLDESTIEMLDWADIETLDLICNGYEWNVGGKSGTKAYLKSLYVTIAEDDLERKYSVEAS